MENEDKIGPANKSEVKIEAHHCWRCSKAFKKRTGEEEEPLAKSMHHAIPKSMKPARNFLIPVCVKCHRAIHNQLSTNNIKLTEYENLLINLEKFVTKHKPKLQKIRDAS